MKTVQYNTVKQVLLPCGNTVCNLFIDSTARALNTDIQAVSDAFRDFNPTLKFEAIIEENTVKVDVFFASSQETPQLHKLILAYKKTAYYTGKHKTDSTIYTPKAAQIA
jgi:hypothetical protein